MLLRQKRLLRTGCTTAEGFFLIVTKLICCGVKICCTLEAGAAFGALAIKEAVPDQYISIW